MKRVNFERISVKNFLSVGEEPVEIDYRPGVNVITGANLDKEDSGNGVGKSSITESIYFALFGHTLRELKATEIKHYSASDPAEVCVEFSVKTEGETHKYELTRNASPSRVELLKDGVDITPSTIPKTNELVKSILGANPEVFQNSVIMTVNSTTPFMAQGKVAKRKFLEGILGLGAFGEMLLLARQDFNNTKSDYQTEYAAYSTQLKSVENLEDLFESHKKNKAEKIEGFKTRIDNNKARITALTEETTELQAELKEYKNSDGSVRDTLQSKISDIESQRMALIEETSGLKHQVAGLKKEVDSKKELPEVCSECGRKLTQKMLQEAEKKIKQTQKTITSLNKDLGGKEEDLLELDNALKEVRAEKDLLIEKEQTIRYKLKTVKSNKSSIDEYKQNVTNLQNDIKKLNEEDKTYSENIKKVQREVSEMQKVVQELDKKMEIYKLSKFIVSEEGIRSFVVKKILKVLNSRLSYYLKTLDANCTCEFDAHFIETLVNDKGHECSYYNFSAGERKRIDLAILFTFQDLRRLQSDASLNLSMYDELLDSSLDKQGIKNVMKVLDERVEKYNECVYIVTHRPDAVDTISGEIIFLEKENGVTRIAS